MLRAPEGWRAERCLAGSGQNRPWAAPWAASQPACSPTGQRLVVGVGTRIRGDGDDGDGVLGPPAAWADSQKGWGYGLRVASPACAALSTAPSAARVHGLRWSFVGVVRRSSCAFAAPGRAAGCDMPGATTSRAIESSACAWCGHGRDSAGLGLVMVGVPGLGRCA